jgi:hypothetical protein
MVQASAAAIAQVANITLHRYSAGEIRRWIGATEYIRQWVARHLR